MARLRRRGDRRVLLPHRAGGGIPRVGEDPIPRFGLSLVQLLEGLLGHVDLPAYLEDRRMVFAQQPQGDRFDGSQVRRDVLAGHPVTSRGAR